MRLRRLRLPGELLGTGRARLRGSVGGAGTAGARPSRRPSGPGAFDAATMIRTLHHMADPAAALRRIRLALSPGAAFVLEYANKRNLKAILRWFLRRQSWSPFSEDRVEFTRLNYDFHPRPVPSRAAGREPGEL